MSPTIAPAEAWLPLPPAEWDAAAARHLLRRAGWTARPAETERAVKEGLAATLDRLFPAQPAPLVLPDAVAKLRAEAPALARGLQGATDDQERRRLRREARERTQAALQDLSLAWLQYAAQPDQAAFAKWVLFLSDVYVVGIEKVKNTVLIADHYDLLARHALGPAPELTKAVSRSPAMVVYLDLNQNRPDAPNENFARELFELFVLGEGHYTEADIKQAARAFTGYRQLLGTYRFAPRQHDGGVKTVFGETGRFGGDDVIDLAYGQPAAATFLPHELVKFYLSDQPLPPEWLVPLGDEWRRRGFHLRELARLFFGSRLFYAPENRGDFIKSPVQFYLGLMQDLDLDVTPLARTALVPLRQMGQVLFDPPNVRGWVGGRNWINSSTLAARRQLVEALFRPLREEVLNADEQRALAAARSAGPKRFTVERTRFAALAPLDPGAATDGLLGEFLALAPTAPFREQVRRYLASAADDATHRGERLRRAAVILLQSPEYQLC
ncbi:MAG: DUF1800 domain-containing protein [Verrucomicrobia bacterium]|nr:DUF1800 domain-containing protein [Verrucomicrobiota bacterium]